MRIAIALLTAALLALHQSQAGEAARRPAKVPAHLELRDQFDTPQRFAFPMTNVLVLTIADNKGSEQIDGWVAALKIRYAGRIDLRGLADVGGVPAMLRGRVRRKFQETRKYPVMMDWSGTNCAAFGYEKGVAKILLLGRDGTICARFSGAATSAAVAEVGAALDKILSAPVQPTPTGP